MGKEQADVWVVAAPPGAGKTTVADILLQLLDPTPALLDKDTMCNPFEDALSREAGNPFTVREGDWYNEHVKPYMWASMFGTTREVRSKGCPVILSMPLTMQTRYADQWAELVETLGGGTVRLIWINTDAETLRHRIESRGSHRDTEKLKNFQAWIERMQPGVPPPVPHIAIDNCLSATESLEDQVKVALAELQRS